MKKQNYIEGLGKALKALKCPPELKAQFKDKLLPVLQALNGPSPSWKCFDRAAAMLVKKWGHSTACSFHQYLKKLNHCLELHIGISADALNAKQVRRWEREQKRRPMNHVEALANYMAPLPPVRGEWKKGKGLVPAMDEICHGKGMPKPVRK